MTIIKAKNSIEAYKALSKSKNINEITGRSGRPDLSKFVTDQMSKRIKINKNSVVVDIGCGDGEYLLKSTKNLFGKFNGKLIGILPSYEEIERVKKHLKITRIKEMPAITIKFGTTNETNLPTSYSDITVCNGVLCLAGTSLEDIKLALSEFSRITKKGGDLYIGEIPNKDESGNKKYGDSILRWLYWVLKNESLISFFKKLIKLLIALFTSEPFIVYTQKTAFFMEPKSFIKLVGDYGFEIKEYNKHLEINKKGFEYESKSRWDYLFVKIS